VLVLEDVQAGYGSVIALRGVSLRVDKGEIVGLIGVNGAGKTTVLSAISGLIRASRGDIRFEGESLVGRSPEDIVRKGIGMVPEGRRIFPGLTVAENLRLGAAIRRDRAAVQTDIDKMCQRFPVLGRRLHSGAGKLSGGEQQQLAVARALMCRPKLVMLDEPSLGLAPKLVDEIFDLVVELRDGGVTILMVEQNVAKTLRVVDRAYLMTVGRIVAEGSAQELAQKVDIQSAYLGRGAGPAKEVQP
jgi:branched-chain amino acid transport system ATP-binding protein